MRGAPGAEHQVQAAVCPEEAGGAPPGREQPGRGHVLVPKLLCLSEQPGVRLACQQKCKGIKIVPWSSTLHYNVLSCFKC